MSEEKSELVKVTFENEEGKSIVCNVRVFQETQELSLEVDFGEEGSNDHEGLYVGLLKTFIEIFNHRK